MAKQGKRQKQKGFARTKHGPRPAGEYSLNISGAAGHYQKGQLREAEQICFSILQQDPNHADALHLLGAIAYGRGQYERAISLYQQSLASNSQNHELHNNIAVALVETGKLSEAIAHYGRALEINPDYGECHSNLGNALRIQGKLDEAIACQMRALELRPDYPEGHNNLGSAYKQQGDLERAVACYQQAVTLRPHYAEAYNNLGTALGQQEKYDRAIEYFQQAIACKPNYTEAYSNLGTAKLKQGKYAEAVAYGQQAIALDPLNAEVHNNIANALGRLGNIDEAIAHFRQAVSINPGSAEYNFNLAAALQEQKNFPEAVTYYQHAIALKPDYGQAYNNLGTVLQDRGKLTEAIDYYHQTLKVEPGFAEAYNNLGSAYQERGNVREAIASYREAIGLRPDYGEAHKNLGMVLLLSGDFQQGWAEYEWRWQCPDFQKEHQTAYNRPRWDGSDLQGRTILLDAEQGFGDMIQFIRYVQAVRTRGGRILFTCPELLVRLFRSLPDISQLLITRDTLPDFDVWAPLMSLPYILGAGETPASRSTIPAPVSYLHPGSEALKCLLRTEAEALKCLLQTGNIKVGIVWSSKPNHPTGRHRSCSLSDFLPLLEIPDISFFSLQKGPQVQALSSGEYNIVNLDDFLYDFADTAAVIQHLDLVITVDTAVAHLAGALGKQVWTLLPFAPDWRWLRDRPDSPWYPTMGLFRQSQPGDWTGVFPRVKAALESFVSQFSRSESVPSSPVPLTPKKISDLDAELRIALAHHQAGKLQDAERIYSQIIQQEPHNADAIQLLGAIAHQRDKLEDAVDLYSQALQLRPDYPEAHNNIAITLQKQGNITDAIAHYQRAIALKPNFGEYYSNLGTAFQTQDNLTEAIACYDKALALNQGDDAKVYNNVAAAKQSLGRVEEAIGYFRQALAIKPDYAEAHKNLGMALLLSGDLQQGFAEYEWRWQCPEFASKYRDGRSPLWDSSDLEGRTILLECEQGFGDAIQFIRYVPLVQARGGNVIVKCRQPLVRLFQTLPGIGKVVEQKSPVPAFDLHLPLMSLPHILGTTLLTVPAQVPYLYAREGEKALKCLLRTEDKFKVGLVWAGSKGNNKNHIRSISLAELLPILELEDIQFYSLQKEEAARQIATVKSNIISLDARINDFADTAAIIQQLDLVITVDTAVAHLAGALAKPVWVLLPFVPDWRWLLHRPDSPWYPTMRLFRQPQLGDWQTVVSSVRSALQSFQPVLTNDTITDRVWSKPVDTLPVVGSPQTPLKKGGFRKPPLLEGGVWGGSLATNADHTLTGMLNAATAYHQQGKLTEASAIYRQILVRDPAHLEATHMLGAIAHAEGKPHEAIALYKQCLQVKPDSPEVHSNLGIALWHQLQVIDAVSHLQQAIALDPNYAEAHNNLAIVLQQQDNITAAIGHYHQALRLRPDYPDAHYNLANALKQRGDLDAAIAQYRQAIALGKSSVLPAAYNNQGNALQELGRVQEAIASFREAIALEANYAEAHYNLALALLLWGNLKEGFAEYEWRWQCPGFVEKFNPKRSFPVPLWDGSDLNGRQILLYAEQGFGDTMQFIRYIPLVQQRGGRVILECQASLLGLFSHSFGDFCQVVPRGSVLPPFDLQAPLISLPHILGTTLETVPAQVPYFHQTRTGTGETPVLRGSDKFKVGIVWAGSKGNNKNHLRSLSLAQLLPILELENIQFYSLQKEEAVRELPTVGSNIISLDPQINDFADTAAIIQELDLVITVDTAVAHLAGALGKTVWVLLPFVPDWRWLLERPDSPWYPTMRLFRQPQLGDWQSVVSSVRSALQSFKPSLTNDKINSMLDKAVAHHQGGRLSAAADIYRQVLQQDPSNADAIHLLGEIAYQRGDVETAIAHYQHSLNINPENADALNNMAATLQQQGKLDEAIAHYRRAQALKPHSPKILCNIGATLIERGQVDEAQRYLRQVLVLDPHYAHGHYNLAMALLLSGDLQQGFAEYEWRWQCPEIAKQTPAHSLSGPLWDGTPFPGRTILLYEEQGLGDSIQFIRYVPLVKQFSSNVKVIVACPQALKRLFSTMPGIDLLIAPGEPLPEFHLRAPLMSLPRLLGTTLENIPAQVPYLYVGEGEGEALKCLLRTSEELKVGIVWASKPNHPTSGKRSCDLSHFLQLLSLPNITLYSLQKDFHRPPELQDNPSANIIFLGDRLGDFADTAAIIAELDLVITVDTSVAHLAGALGKPVWVLLPFAPNWRWLRERSDSPWYPTMRLFRQTELGDWSGVFVRVHKALHSLISVLTGDSQDRGSRTDNRNHGALLNTAVAHHQSGRLQQAEELYWQILRSDPATDTRSSTLYLLGTIGHQSGKLDVAISYYQQSLALGEDKAEVHNNLAIALQQRGKVNEAIGHYQRALAIQPHYPEVHSNLGNAWRELGKITEAIGHYRTAISLRPDYPEAYCNLADTLKKQGNLDEAISAYQQVLALRPDMAEIHNFLGQALAEKDLFAPAIESYQRAIALGPDNPEGYNNLGAAYYQQSHVTEAIDSYRKAIALGPDYAYAHKNLGIALLRSGDLEAGFAEYEWRWQCQDFSQENPLPWPEKPLWQGEDLQGKTILIYCEQGLGDSIQFIRYLPLLPELGGKTIVGCPRSLKQLFSTVAAIDRVVTTGDPSPEFDCYVPLLSLPHLLGTTLETIPAQVPYLYPRAVMRNPVSGPIDKLKLGIAWATQLHHPTGRKRSCSLKDFLEMLDLPSLDIVSLQKEVPPREKQTSMDSKILFMDEMLDDFADTAALVDQLDLIITVDTSIAHLAGALGKPVWVLLPFVSDWRWMLDRTDSPWYPTMQLFRQQQPGDWSAVFLAVQRALRSFLAGDEYFEDDRLLTITNDMVYPKVGQQFAVPPSQ